MWLLIPIISGFIVGVQVIGAGGDCSFRAIGGARATIITTGLAPGAGVSCGLVGFGLILLAVTLTGVLIARMRRYQ